MTAKIIITERKPDQSLDHVTKRADAPIVGYATHQGEHYLSVMFTDDQGTMTAVCLTPDIVDRLARVQEQWARETAHRGRSVE